MNPLEIAEAANDAGRQRFAVQDYSGACEHFTAALASIGSAHSAARAKYLSNRAASHLQLRNYSEAIEDSSAALKLDANNVKALIRRGDAYTYAEAFERAVTDYDAALKLLLADNSGSDAVQTVLSKRKSAAASAGALKRANAAPGATVPAELLSDQHSKRVYFRFSVPPTVKRNEPFPVAIYVANEVPMRGGFPLVLGSFRRVNARVFTQFGLHKRGSSEGWRVQVRNLSETTDVSVDPPTPRLDERGQAEFLLTVAEQQRHGGPAVLPLTAQIVVQCEPIDGASPPLPVVSPPITVVVEEASSGETKWEPDAVVTNCRLFEVGSKSVVLLESIGELGVAGRLWDCGVVLLQYFAQFPECLADRCVLELGAGTGVVGLGVGALGASQVIITDMPAVCPLIDRNIRLSQLSSVCKSAPLVWGEDVPDNLKPDVVIAADVVYEPEYFHALATTFVTLCSRVHDCVGYLAYRPRHPDGQLFFDELSAHFVCEPLVFPPASSKGITIFKLTTI